jgi:chromate reductase
MFITPEYNRSIPGVLKNVIDHASRPYGQSVWAGKTAGVIGVSIGAMATALAQQNLRNILAYLDMPTLGQPEVFIQAKEGPSAEVGTPRLLQRWGRSGRLPAFIDRSAMKPENDVCLRDRSRRCEATDLS